MPQAIIGVLVTALGTIGVTGLAATLIATVVAIGVTVGVNALLNSIFGPSRPKPSDGQQNVRIAVGSRRRHYGIVHTGGQQTFLDSANGTLGQVITLGTGHENEILEHRINDKVVTLTGGTVNGASYHGAIHVYTRSGADDQTAIGELTAKFPDWTSDHRQRGCAHAAVIADPVKQEYFSETFNGQMPQYTQVRKAVSVYDPRLDSTAVIGTDDAGDPIYGAGAHRLNDRTTWTWSDNGVLVTADYFAHEDGYGGGFDTVNWTNIAQEADRADETELTVTGEMIARWRIWASYSLASEERRQILTDMLKAIDGFCWQDADGKFNLITGRFEMPDLTITDDHILGMSATLGTQAQRGVSAIKMLYTEAAIGYREQESATIFDPEAEDDPNTSAQGVEAYYAPHHNQAMRLGKIIFAQLGDRWHITAQINLFGLNLLGRRFCRVESNRLGVAAYFKVDGLRLNLAQCTVEATLSEVKPEDWNFDAVTEEGTPPLAPDAPALPPALSAPTGLALSAVQIVLGGATGVAIAASWDDPGRADLMWAAQYRPSAGGDWVPMLVDQEAQTARSSAVDSGTEYTVWLRALTITGRPSPWESAIITPTAAAAVLGPPTELAATGGTGEADVSFRMPTGATLDYARLYHAATSDFGSATQVGGDIVGALGAVIDVTDTGLSTGAQYYWARAFDGSGTPSALAGPVMATIS